VAPIILNADSLTETKFLSVHIKLGKRSPCTSDFVVEVSLDGRTIHPIPLKRNNNTEIVVNGWFVHDDEDNMLARIPFKLGRVVSNSSSLPCHHSGVS
jgi:hypothetical protein